MLLQSRNASGIKPIAPAIINIQKVARGSKRLLTPGINLIIVVIGALEAVVQYLSETLAISNCLYFRKLGIIHSLSNLVNQADLFILKHFEKIIKQSEFFDFDLDGLTKLCASDDLNVSELLCVNYVK